jgi:hypothetical protein
LIAALVLTGLYPKVLLDAIAPSAARQHNAAEIGGQP